VKRKGLSPRLLIPDTHWPFADLQYWNLLLQVGHWLKPDVIIDLGDFVDHFSISKHSKSPKRLLATSMKLEMETARLRRAELDKLGAKRKVFIKGNHEARWDKWLNDNVGNEFFITKIGTFQDEIRLEQNGWEVFEYGDFAKVDGAYFTHDVSTGGEGSARKAGERFMGTNAQAHTHGAVQKWFRNMDGKVFVSTTLGHGSDENAQTYASRTQKRDWVKMIGIDWYDPQRQNHHLQGYPVMDGTVVIGGKLFSAPFVKKPTEPEPIMDMGELVKKHKLHGKSLG